MYTVFFQEQKNLLSVCATTSLYPLETSEGRDSLEAKAKRFYRSCMNTRAIERQGSEPFLNLIQQVSLGLDLHVLLSTSNTPTSAYIK